MSERRYSSIQSLDGHHLSSAALPWTDTPSTHWNRLGGWLVPRSGRDVTPAWDRNSIPLCSLVTVLSASQDHLRQTQVLFAAVLALSTLRAYRGMETDLNIYAYSSSLNLCEMGRSTSRPEMGHAYVRKFDRCCGREGESLPALGFQTS